jgi:hypothetical protein
VSWHRLHADQIRRLQFPMIQASQSESKTGRHHCSVGPVFDPWTTALEQAVLYGGDGQSGTVSLLAQKQAASQVMKDRDACLAPDGGCAVLHCLSICLANDLTPPKWLRDAFIQRHSTVVNAQGASWDDAFGRPWPTRTRLASERQAMRLKKVIHAAVLNLVRNDPALPIKRDLFERVGEMPGIHKSGATVERLYYKALSDGLPNVAQLRSML